MKLGTCGKGQHGLEQRLPNDSHSPCLCELEAWAQDF